MKLLSLAQRNIKHLYIHSVMNGLVAVMVPVMILFFMKEVGLSLSQILIGEAIFALTILLFEIPSGYLADRYGRTKAQFWAEVLFFLAFAVLSIANSFELFILGQILAGVAIAAASGAKDALLFDSLKYEKREIEYRAIRGRINTILFSVSIFSNLIGGFIAASFGLRSVIILATAVIALSVINITFLKDPPVDHQATPPVPLKKSFRYVKKHPLIRQILLFSIVMALAMKISFQTLNPYWELMEVPLVLFGIAMAFQNLMAAIASLVVEKLKKWSDFIVLIFLTSLVSLTFLTMATGIQFEIIVIIVLGSLFQIARAWWPVITEDAVNQVTFSQHRATVLSIKSFAQQSSQVALLPLFGFIADWWSLYTAFLILSLFVFVLGLMALWPLRKID